MTKKTERWSDEELLVAFGALLDVIKKYTGPDGWCYIPEEEIIALANVSIGGGGRKRMITSRVIEKLIEAGGIVKDRVHFEPYEKYVYGDFGGVIRFRVVKDNEQEVLELYKSIRKKQVRRKKTPKSNKPGNTVFI